MHNGDWFVDFVKNVLRVTLSPEQESFLGIAAKPKFKVGDAVRVKAGSPVHPDKTGHPGWRSSPYQAAFGRKLVVRGCDTDRNGLCVRVEYDGDVEGMDVRYLEPWNDAEEWNGEKWVAKKPSLFPEYLKEIFAPRATKPAIVLNREPWNDAEEWNGEKWVAKKVEKWPDSYFQKPAIVINRTNGVLKPATHPFVHPSAIEAEVEAKRLAELVKGEEFVVFEEVGSRRVEKPALKVGDWVKIVGPSNIGDSPDAKFNPKIGIKAVVKSISPREDSQYYCERPGHPGAGLCYPASSLEPASPPEKSKAEKMVEAIKDHDVTGFSVDGDVIASIDHLEASATGNIVTVKYHLKP